MILEPKMFFNKVFSLISIYHVLNFLIEFASLIIINVNLIFDQYLLVSWLFHMIILISSFFRLFKYYNFVLQVLKLKWQMVETRLQIILYIRAQISNIIYLFFYDKYNINITKYIRADLKKKKRFLLIKHVS